jgi:hypothetical protein
MNMTSSRLFWPLFLFLLAAIFAFHPVQNLDFWWHLSSARWIMENGALPTTDPFTFTAVSTPWIYNGWLGSIIIYLAYTALGSFGVVLLQMMMVVSILWLVFKTCGASEIEKPSIWLVILFFVGTYGLSLGFFVRPHMFSTLCFASLLYLLKNEARLGRHLLWMIPVLFVAWVNLHAGAMLGVITVFLFYIGFMIDRRFVLSSREWKAIALQMVLSLVAIFINPYGAQLALLPVHHALDPTIANALQEWKSVFEYPIKSYIPLVVFWAFVVSAVFNYVVNFKKLGFAWLGVSTFTLGLALSHVRFMPFFILLQIPLIYRGIKDRVSTRAVAPERSILLAAFIVMLFAYNYGIPVTLTGMKLYPEWNINNSQITPVAAVEFIKRMPAQRIFNDMVFGGYLIWKLSTSERVFIDGRVELYDPAFYQKYDRTAYDPSALEALCNQYKLDTIMLSTNRVLMGQRVPNGWKSIYQDGHATIFARPTSQTPG